MAIFYECQRCTACCRWPGEVRVGEDEIRRLAGFLAISEDAFIQRYLRLRPDRSGLALAEKPNGECVFLAGEDCQVQPAKPKQCRDFPNLWNFPGFEKTCRAIPQIVSDEERRRRLELEQKPSHTAAVTICHSERSEESLLFQPSENDGNPALRSG